MYLSRVQVDTENVEKMKSLTHLGAYHSWVETSFPEEFQDNERSRKLWRLDTLQGKQYMLLVSCAKPNLTNLEKYGVPGTAETRSCDALLDGIQNGQSYYFRVVLNPVHTHAEPGAKRGRMYPEVTIPKQKAYFERKAAENGFEPLVSQITQRSYVTLKKSHQPPLKLCLAAYEGILCVTNAEKLRKALCTGIGRKKAYGFGMMTLVPVNAK